MSSQNIDEQIQQQNKELIDKAREESKKSKGGNNTWVTIVWAVVLVIFAVGVILAIVNAITQSAIGSIDNYVNVTISAENTASNLQLFSGLKSPADTADYTVFVTNDKESSGSVYVRFFAKTIINDDEVDDNIIELLSSSQNAYYDAESDMYYLNYQLAVGHKAQLCSKLRIAKSASNTHANKYIKFTITVDAISTQEEVWADAPQEWLDIINYQG